MVDEPVLDVDEIQGNVFPGFNKPFMKLLFFTMTDVSQCRRWLMNLGPQMATMSEVLAGRRLYRALRERRGSDPTNLHLCWANICISDSGMARLRIPMEEFTDRAFREGMVTRSPLLGDPVGDEVPGDPSTWVVGGTEDRPDFMMILGSDNATLLEEEVERFKAEALHHRMRLVFEQAGGERPDAPGREHFGFEDGISHPGIRGMASTAEGDYLTPREIDPAYLPEALLYGRPGEDLVWPGEFIFGYAKQSPDPLIYGDQASAGPDWAKNGSYVVFRRLYQNVAEFRRFIAEKAAELREVEGFDGITPDLLAARLVGRWPSGAPISRVPDRDNEALGRDPHANNYFGFGQTFDPLPLTVPDYAGDNYRPAQPDPLGLVCPHASHIRKMNPRDVSSDDGGHMAQYRRRIIRRGLPYGPAYSEETAGTDRGLLFISYQSSIEDQFEFLSNAWLGDRAPPREPGGDDIFIGQNGRPGENRVRRCVLLGHGGQAAGLSTEGYREWVRPTGGGYFFAPSITLLMDGMDVG